MTTDLRPGRPAEIYPGIYRGVVESVGDPEQRKRYRVRVTNVHPPAVDSAHLPWSELAGGFGGSTFGDVPSYAVDDAVWVMFEGGNRRFPVIIGGIFNFAGGIPPIPPEQTGDEIVAERWVRVDRKGNKIEMSPLDDELWVRIVTPDGSEVRVSAADGSILLSGEGRVRLVAPNVQIDATEEMNLLTPKLIADVTEECTIRGSDIVNVRGANEINIGEYEPPDTTGLGSVPETSLVVNIKAVNEINVESAGLIDIDAAGEIQVDAGSHVRIVGQADASITVEGNVLLDAEGNVEADIEGTLTIDSAGRIVVEGQAEIEVNAGSSFLITAGSSFTIQAAADLTLDGQTNIVVTAGAALTLEASANLEISCAASLSISAQGVLSLDAPQIEISAQALLDMNGGSTTRIDGAFIQIG